MDKLRFERFSEEKHHGLVCQLTKLLHESYKPLAEKGMRYTATHQSEAITLKRLNKGKAFLSFVGPELIGTITLVKQDLEEPAPWYLRDDVQFFTQFAVRNDLQGLGIGKKMIALVEDEARRDGAKEIALDTSENATELISLYNFLGYRFVEFADWEETNYRSVILSKKLVERQ